MSHCKQTMVFLVLLIASYCFGYSIKNSPHQKNSEEDVPEIELPNPIISDYNCYDVHNKPYTEIIPHEFNCQRFVLCSEYEPGKVSGHLQICQNDQVGEPLYFSMDSCNCEYQNEAICYDPNNSTHAAQRLKCACPLNGNYEEDDDRCSNRRRY